MSLCTITIKASFSFKCAVKFYCHFNECSFCHCIQTCINWNISAKLRRCKVFSILIKNKISDSAFLPKFTCEQESPFSGEIECDESYFGSRYQSGKRGRGAENKHIVFGIYKRNGKVYTEIVKNVKAKTLQAIIKGKVSFDSTLYTDGFRSFGFDRASRLSETFSDLSPGQLCSRRCSQ